MNGSEEGTFGVSDFMEKPDKWKDVSSFSRGDNVRKPNSFSRHVGMFRISVHRHIHYPADTWLLSCRPFFDCKELASKDINSAKCQAVALVQVELEKAIADIVNP